MAVKYSNRTLGGKPERRSVTPSVHFGRVKDGQSAISITGGLERNNQGFTSTNQEEIVNLIADLIEAVNQWPKEG